MLRDMGMHPMRPGTCGKVIAARLSGLEHRHRQGGHPALYIWLDLTLPVDDGRCVKRIGQINREGLPWIKDKAGTSVAVEQAPDCRSLALHLNGPRCVRKGHPGGLSTHLGGQKQSSGRSRSCGKEAAPGQKRHMSSPVSRRK